MRFSTRALLTSQVTNYYKLATVQSRRPETAVRNLVGDFGLPQNHTIFVNMSLEYLEGYMCTYRH